MKEGFQLRGTPEKGEGVFSTKAFQTAETVMIGRVEKKLTQNHSHASQVAKRKYVLHAGLISKVNHSCNPNCGIKDNEFGGHDFIARRNIPKNEELTFDYAMRNYGIDHFPVQCMCGAKECRGQITGWKDLSDEQKGNYKGYIASYLLDIDAKIPTKKLDPVLSK